MCHHTAQSTQHTKTLRLPGQAFACQCPTGMLLHSRVIYPQYYPSHPNPYPPTASADTCIPVGADPQTPPPPFALAP